MPKDESKKKDKKSDKSLEQEDSFNDEDKEERKSKRKHKKEKQSDDEEKEKEVEPKKEAKKEVKKEEHKEESLTTLVADVHSANNWEEADLGDDKRKLKFLKLMGATKHKDEGDVAHKHARAATETQKLNTDLEKQFNESLHNKMNRSHHVGLGFGGGVSFSRASDSEPKNKHIKFDDEESGAKKDSSASSKPSATPDSKSKYKMSFVKSNNS